MSTPAVGIAFTQLLRDLRERFSRRDLATGRLPWMKMKELDAITEILVRLAPRDCLEWGAGSSTLYFPPRLPSVERWVSVEHNREWFAEVARANHDARVRVVHVPPDQGEFNDTKREGTAADFRTYIDYPRTLGRQFDFIFIDGRARADCLREAFSLLSDTGVVVVHDANRAAYMQGRPAFAHEVRLADHRTRKGGVFIASRGRPIAEILDVARQQRIWRAHDVLNKLLFLR